MEGDDPVARLRADVRRGAAELAVEAASAAEEMLASVDPADAGGWRRELVGLARRMAAAQPAIAPVVNLAAEIVRAVDGDGGGARRRVSRVVTDFRRRLDAAADAVADHAAALIAPGARVLTVSRSSTVAAALRRAGPDRIAGVVCLEGRPNLEGRGMAELLADAGLEVTVAVDAAAGVLVPRCDVVVVGADAIGDEGVANKIGTRAVLLLAREAGVPRYAVADGTKLLPAGWPQTFADARPAAEVWKDAPAGVAVWNEYFETSPPSLFTGIVTEDGMADPGELEASRRRVTLPPALADAVPGRS